MKRSAFFTSLAFGLCIAPSPSPAADEATVTAAYVYNFAKYIQWPDEQRTILRLCVLGDTAFDRVLDSLIGKPVRTMRIGVRHAVALLEIPQCDLVFVTAVHTQSLQRMREIANNFPILIVAEGANELPKGAMVALIPSDNRIVFEVDLDLTRQVGLQVSAKMLQLARKVY
jgi:hypothetical protein